MLNVVTMYFTKPRPGDHTEGRRDFWVTEGAKYLRRMLLGCRRHIAEPFTFYVITDDLRAVSNALAEYEGRDTPIRYLIVEDNEDVPGWWMKLKLFDPKFGIAGRTLYLDLDNVVSGDLSALLALALPEADEDYNRGRTNLEFYMADDRVYPGMANGSVLFCRPEQWHDLWREYHARPARIRAEFSEWPKASDQAYIANRVEQELGYAPLLFQDLLPKHYLLNSRVELEKGCPWADTALVYGSWKPKPHESTHPFYAQHWVD